MSIVFRDEFSELGKLDFLGRRRGNFGRSFAARPQNFLSLGVTDAGRVLQGAGGVV